MTDALLLQRHGEFFRYLSSKMRIIVVDVTESEFYVKNVQEPISRAYQIIFKTILFSGQSFIIEEEDESFPLFRISVLCFDVLSLFVLILRWAARPWNLLSR